MLTNTPKIFLKKRSENDIKHLTFASGRCGGHIYWPVLRACIGFNPALGLALYSNQCIVFVLCIQA